MNSHNSSNDAIYFKNFLTSNKKNKMDVKEPLLFVTTQVLVIGLLSLIIVPIYNSKNNPSSNTSNNNESSINQFETTTQISESDEVSTTFSDNKDAISMSSMIPESAVYNNGSYYQLYSDLVDSWEDASNYCDSLGGHLAIINDLLENDFLYHYMIENGFQSAYFGLFDKNNDGSWIWVDGSNVSFSNWADGEPNSNSEPYGMFYYKYTDGTWNDGRWGDDTTAFICEWEDNSLEYNENIITTYLDQLQIIESDRYTGNEGDSFIYPIGKHQYTKGNTCTDGESYEHGIEGWLARWNGTKETSWAYSVFHLNKQYTSITGECKLIHSYNTTDFDTTLEFWNENSLIQSYRLTPDTIPFNISLNVSDCDLLKVYFYDNEAKAGGTSFGLVNMELSSSMEATSSDYSVQHISDFRSHITSVTSSSHLESQTYGNITYDYFPEKMIDNDTSTCWSEGADGYGVGESIALTFDDVYEISGLSLWNGLCTSEDLFYKNSRLHNITVVLSNGNSYDFECMDGWDNRQTVLQFNDSVETSSLTIIIQSVYEGDKYKDTCISEISVS